MILTLSLVVPSQALQSKKTAPKKAAEKDWPLLKCGKDLKSTSQTLDAYQKKLIQAGKKMNQQQRAKLYSGSSVLAESMTLLAPEIFWENMISTRVHKGCFQRLTALKKSMSTNDSRGTPSRLKAWNECVLSQYGAYPKQTRQINQCVKQGLAYIQKRQR